MALLSLVGVRNWDPTKIFINLKDLYFYLGVCLDNHVFVLGTLNVPVLRPVTANFEKISIELDHLMTISLVVIMRLNAKKFGMPTTLLMNLSQHVMLVMFALVFRNLSGNGINQDQDIIVPTHVSITKERFTTNICKEQRLLKVHSWRFIHTLCVCCCLSYQITMKSSNLFPPTQDCSCIWTFFVDMVCNTSGMTCKVMTCLLLASAIYETHQSMKQTPRWMASYHVKAVDDKHESAKLAGISNGVIIRTFMNVKAGGLESGGGVYHTEDVKGLNHAELQTGAVPSGEQHKLDGVELEIAIRDLSQRAVTGTTRSLSTKEALMKCGVGTPATHAMYHACQCN